MAYPCGRIDVNVTSANIRIHLVDDAPTQRSALRRTIEKKLEATGPPISAQFFDKYQYIWDLVPSPTLESPNLRAGDMVVCDLYPSGYWHLINTTEWGLGSYTPEEPLGDSVQNMKNACFDIAERFLGPLEHEKRVHIFVLTYVPPYFRSENINQPQAAEEVLDKLRQQKLTHVSEKKDRSRDEVNFIEIADAIVLAINESRGSVRA